MIHIQLFTPLPPRRPPFHPPPPPTPPAPRLTTRGFCPREKNSNRFRSRYCTCISIGCTLREAIRSETGDTHSATLSRPLCGCRPRNSDREERTPPPHPFYPYPSPLKKKKKKKSQPVLLSLSYLSLYCTFREAIRYETGDTRSTIHTPRQHADWPELSVSLSEQNRSSSVHRGRVDVGVQAVSFLLCINYSFARELCPAWMTSLIQHFTQSLPWSG